MTFLTDDLVTREIKEIIEKNEEFRYAKFFCNKNFYIISDIFLKPKELKQYKEIMDKRAIARVLKKDKCYIKPKMRMITLQRDMQKIRYQRSIELLNGEVANALIGFYKEDSIDIAINYQNEEINLNYQKDKTRQIVHEILMPELKLITSLRTKEKQNLLQIN